MVEFMGVRFNDSMENIKAAYKDFLRDFLMEELEKDLAGSDTQVRVFPGKKIEKEENTAAT